MEQVANVEACRLCANFYVTGAEVNFVHLFEPLTELEQQLEFVRTQTLAWQLNISANDGLPQRICANCFAQFCNIQSFRQQCILAQQKLLQSFVGVGLAENDAAAGVGKQQTNNAAATAALTSDDSELLSGLKIGGAPVTSAELMASLDCLQPPTTTSADVIASLEGLQLPASVAETLNLLTQELTTMQNGSLLDTSANSITTHAMMDTKTEETNVLQFSAASTTQNIYYAQQTPITTETTAATTTTTTTTTTITPPPPSPVCDAVKSRKSDIDLEDMLHGSIIPKNSNSNRLQQAEIYDEVNEEVFLNKEEETRHSFSSYENMIDEDMDSITCSDQDDPNELDDFDADAESTSQTRISRNPFACQYCYCPNAGSIDHLVFESADALSQHFFDVHDPNLPYTCPYCPQKYSSAKQRDYHVRLMHPTISRADQCEYCKKTLRGPKELHEFSCQYVGDWRCERCDECFYRWPLGRFRNHQRNHASKKQLRCRDCGRIFVRRANLEAHERMHQPRSNFKTACDECQEVFANDYELRRHKYQTHHGALPVRCEYCHKGFVSMAFLSRHRQHFHPEKSDGNQLSYATCTNCGCVFSSQHKLRVHIQRPRDENGRCIELRQVEPYQERTRQIRRTKLHNCEHCNKRFSTQATLEKHMSTHEVVTYGCHECSLSFLDADELRRHIVQIHTKPRYLKCDQCGKRFCYVRELQLHQKMHEREADALMRRKNVGLTNFPAQTKTFSCPILNCDFKATSTKEAHKHAFFKHKLVACEYCDCLFTPDRLPTHLSTVHGIVEPNNNNTNNTNTANVQETHTAESLAMATILNTTDSVQLNNSGIIVAFEDTAINSSEKVRVELVQQQTPSISTLVLQEQTSCNSYKSLIPSAADMEQNLLMSALLDQDHEIIVA